MSLHRIAQNTAELVLHDFGSWTDAPVIGDVTVRVVGSDGTELVPTTSVPEPVTGQTYGYLITPDLTGVMDRLTVFWTATVDGTAQTVTDTVEIVGGVLFTLADIRRIRPLDDVAAYPPVRVLEMRVRVEQALENELGFALVPRLTSERLSLTGTPRLRWPYVRAIRSVTDTTGQVVDPATIQFDDMGFVSTTPRWYTPRWGTTRAWTVQYEHGLDPDNEISEYARQEALLLAKVWLVSGPVDDRATSFSSTETGATYSMVVPGRGGSIFGVPSVDAFVQSNRLLAIA